MHWFGISFLHEIVGIIEAPTSRVLYYFRGVKSKRSQKCVRIRPGQLFRRSWTRLNMFNFSSVFIVADHTPLTLECIRLARQLARTNKTNILIVKSTEIAFWLWPSYFWSFIMTDWMQSDATVEQHSNIIEILEMWMD